MCAWCDRKVAEGLCGVWERLYSEWLREGVKSIAISRKINQMQALNFLSKKMLQNLLLLPDRADGSILEHFSER